MSAYITNNYPGSIGRMFARQNVPSIYGAQKSSTGVEAEEAGTVTDNVSLSPFAPKPLTSGFLEQALDTGKTLGEGSTLSGESESRLREDRVFAAVSALALLGYNENQNLSGWPGGIPTPSREEVEAARRRLAQRPRDTGDASSYESVMAERIQLLQRIGKSDFSGLAMAESEQVGTVAGAE